MEKMKELYEKVAKDSALQTKFAAIMKEAAEAGEETNEKLTAFAKEAGYEVTIGEMQDFFKTRTESNGELSESELDMVAGGKVQAVQLTISITTIGIGCAAASAIFAVLIDDCKGSFEA